MEEMYVKDMVLIKNIYNLNSNSFVVAELTKLSKTYGNVGSNKRTLMVKFLSMFFMNVFFCVEEKHNKYSSYLPDNYFLL